MAKTKNKRRLALFAENPYCHYCGVLTDIEALPNNPIAATVEHLYPRLHPRRQIPNTTGEKRLTIACFKCNNAKSVEDQQKYLTPENLRLRSMGRRNKEAWLKIVLRDLERFDCF